MKLNRKQLEKQLNDARQALNILDKRQQIEANRAYIGRCFRYSNSYGSDDRWWVYRKCLRIVDGEIECLDFEIDSGDTIEIQFQLIYHGSVLDEDWTEIKEEKFASEYLSLLDEVKTIGMNNGIDT